MQLTTNVNRRILYCLFSISVALAGISYADETVSKRVSKEYDMRALSREAQSLRVPILIEFALVHCEFCKRLEADYLAPMADSSEYKTKVLIRRVIIDEEQSLRDFNGDTLAIEQFSARYRAEVTPTVVLLDYDGRQIGKKLVGYTETGFYGGKLDDLIDEGVTYLRR